MQEHYAFLVFLDVIHLNLHAFAALDHKDAFLLTIVDAIVLYYSVSATLSSQCNLSFEVTLDMIGNDLGWGSFLEQYTLTVVISNYIS